MLVASQMEDDMRIRIPIPAGIKEFVTLVMEETLALVAMCLFLATVAVWAGLWCRAF